MGPRNLTENFVPMFEGPRGPAASVRWTPRLCQTTRGGFVGNSRSWTWLHKIRLPVESPPPVSLKFKRRPTTAAGGPGGAEPNHRVGCLAR